MSAFNYPEHKHPHPLLHKQPNGQRILACDECSKFISDIEFQKIGEKVWGHMCLKYTTGVACESHMEMFEPCVPVEKGRKR